MNTFSKYICTNNPLQLFIPDDYIWDYSDFLVISAHNVDFNLGNDYLILFLVKWTVVENK